MVAETSEPVQRSAIPKIENQINHIECLEAQDQFPRAEGSITMAKKKDDPTKQEPANLTVSRAEAHQRLEAQIGKGRQLKDTDLSSEEILKQYRQHYYRWDEYNFELLQRIFSNDSVAREYQGYSFGGLDADEPFQRRTKELHDDLDYKIGSLESILARLELIPEGANVSSFAFSGRPTVGNPPVKSKKVFVVHGHDDAAKLATARFVEKLGLEAVILHEQASGGQTVIEKVEGHSDVGFAVVLLTPDDVGAPKATPNELKPRARQNVIFELGYFVGKLGRKNVCVLYKGVEIPSDFEGVVRVEMDTASAWHVQLAREINHAGIEVDLNKAI
jgi:predicted nucleotide-binding protein